jgi:hypothetical protein
MPHDACRSILRGGIEPSRRSSNYLVGSQRNLHPQAFAHAGRIQ